MQISKELLWEYRWALRPKTLQGQFLLLHMAIAAKAGKQRDLADEDHLDVATGTLSRWLNGTAPLGIEPLKRMAEMFYKEVGGVSNHSLINSDFVTSYHFLEEASARGEIYKSKIPSLADKFLKILDISVEVGQPVPARSNFIKPHGKASSAEPKHRGQDPFRSQSEETDPHAEALTQVSQPPNPDFIARSPEFVARPGKYEEIKSALLSTKGSARNVALTTILHGFGGFGKTTLAKEIYNDPEVRGAFPDGIFWVQCEQDRNLRPELVVDSLLRKCVPSWDRSAISNATTAKRELIRAVSEKQLMLVVDDVWYNVHAELFRGLPPSCVVLMTSRMKHLSSSEMSEVFIDEMTPDEALDVLISNLQSEGQPVSFGRAELATLEKLAKRLGYWAQLLALANGRLRRSLTNGRTLSEAISTFQNLMDKRGIVVLDSRDLSGSANESRSRAMRLCMDASLEMLNDTELKHFLALGVIPKDQNIPIQVVLDYWYNGMGTEADESQDMLEVFSSMSLLRLSSDRGALVTVHDNILDYLNRRHDVGELKHAHQVMVQALSNHCDGMWHKLPTSHLYGWANLLMHLEAANEIDRANDCRTNFHWLKAKVAVVGIHQLQESFDSLNLSAAARLVGRTIALSCPILAENPNGLAHQIFGRLSNRLEPILARLVSEASQDLCFWPKPVTAHLRPLGSELKRIETGERAAATEVALSPNCRTVALGYADQQRISFWRYRTGQRIVHYQTPWQDDDALTVNLNANVFARDGHSVGLLYEDGFIEVKEFENWQTKLKLKGHRDQPTDLVMSTCGEKLFSCSLDKKIMFWDSMSGDLIDQRSFRKAFSRLKVSHDNNYLMCIGSRSGLVVLELGSHDIRIESKGVRCVTDADFSADGSLVFAHCWNQGIIVWSLETGRVVENLVPNALFPNDFISFGEKRPGQIRVVPGEENAITSACLVGRSNSLLFSSFNGCVGRFDIGSSNAPKIVHRGHEPIEFLASDPIEGEFYAIAPHSGQVRVFSTNTDEQVLQTTVGDSRFMTFSANDRELITSHQDGTVRFWGLDSTIPQDSFEHSQDPIESVAVSGTESICISTTNAGSVSIRDARTLAEVERLEACENRHGARVSVSPTSNTILVHSHMCLALSNSSCLEKNYVVLSDEYFTKASFSALGDYIAAIKYSKKLMVFSASSCEIVLQLDGYDIESVEISDQGCMLIAYNYSHMVGVWSLIDGSKMTRFDAHSLPASSLSPDGSRFAVADGFGGQVEIFDSISRELLHTLPKSKAGIEILRFFPSSERILVVHTNGEARIWNYLNENLEKCFEWQERFKTWDTVEISADGRFILASELRMSCVYDLHREEWILSWGNTSFVGIKPVFSATGEMVVSVQEKAIQLWDLQCANLKSRVDFDDAISAAAINSNHIVVGTSAGSLHGFKL